ncbi:MAG: hypothetical protein Q9183_005684, partial [Haloplaca sp. 2 TL-2023]
MADYHIIIPILTWTLLVATIFSLLTRFITKRRYSTTNSPTLNISDILIALATLLAIGQAIAMTLQLRYWDRHTDEYWITDGTPMSKFLKAKYAETLVYIPGICFSQAAMLLLLRELAPAKWQRGFLSGVIGIVLVVGVVSEGVMALWCAVESVWELA